MQEMVEPDRTIVIVSIIGLVVIWGSVLYHKFVQGGRDEGDAASVASEPPAPAPAPPPQEPSKPPVNQGGKQKKNKNKSKRN